MAPGVHRMIGRRLLLPALLAAAAGCATTPPVPARMTAATQLAASAGTVVEVAGERRGPAKLGDFVEVDGTQVYFDVGVAAAVPYGAGIEVVGTLRHVDDADESGCGDGCVQATMPAHWRLDDAHGAPGAGAAGTR